MPKSWPRCNPEIQLDRFLLDAYFGISPLMARELSFRACGETDGRLCNLDEAGRSRFQDAFFAFANCVKEKQLYADRSETGGGSL